MVRNTSGISINRGFEFVDTWGAAIPRDSLAQSDNVQNFPDFRDFDPIWFQNHPSRTGKLGAGTRRPYDCRKTERGRNTTTIRALHF